MMVINGPHDKVAILRAYYYRQRGSIGDAEGASRAAMKPVSVLRSGSA
jgi:hypothetical protein